MSVQAASSSAPSLRIRNRLGQIVNYRRQKIVQAVRLYLVSGCGRDDTDPTRKVASNVADRIEQALRQRDAAVDPADVGLIESLIVEALHAIGEVVAAKQFDTYRAEHRRVKVTTGAMIRRHFTKKGEDVFRLFDYEQHRTVIKHHVTGAVRRDYTAEVPKCWSTTARDILIDKFLRKAQVPMDTVERPGYEHLPEWLRPRQAATGTKFIGETSVRQAVHRMVGHWTFVGYANGYFDPTDDEVGELTGLAEEDSQFKSHDHDDGGYRHAEAALRVQNAKTFYDENVFLILNQMAAPNSPQWFSTGLWWAYGTLGSDNHTHWYVDLPADTRKHKPGTDAEIGGPYDQLNVAAANARLVQHLKCSENAFQRVQAHACFILSVDDEMENGRTGVTDWWKTEARIFKYGSGSGANISNLRGHNEKLSGGGFSSGPMPFIKVADAGGGAVKSGGTTRRAAKMVVMDADHPDVDDFVRCKVDSEMMVAAMVCGSAHVRDHCQRVMDAVREAVREVKLTDATPAKLVKTSRAVREAMLVAAQAHVPSSYIGRAASLAIQGVPKWPGKVFDTEYEGDAYANVPFQNANHTVALTQEFYDAVDADQTWRGVGRKENNVMWERPARAIEHDIAQATWLCGDPGIQYDTNVNDWNYSATDGRIRASNPCVPADTWVMTGKGPRQVKDLIDKPFVALVDGVCRDCPAGFFATGEKQLFEVKLSNGFAFKATAEHKVLVARTQTQSVQRTEWVEIKNLQSRDRVVLHNHRGANLAWETASAGTFDEGWLLGSLFGDGWFVSGEASATLGFWGEHRDSMRTLAAERMHVALGVIDPAGAVVADREHVRVRAPQLFALAKRYGMVNDDVIKDLSDAIERTGSPFHRGFLRGWFDADGSVQGNCKKGVSVRLTSVDRAALHRAQRMLARFGIVSTVYENRRSAGPRQLPDGRGATKAYQCKAYHELVIADDNIRVFADEIGFDDPAKQATLALKLAAYRRKLNRERFTADVASVSPAGTEAVYDCTVRNVHAFDANGCYLHNCGEHRHLDDTACNLASGNVLRFLREDGTFDVESYLYAVHLQQIVLDVTVQMAHLPERNVALGTYNYRDTGLGYGNLGATLMCLGLPYDSNEGRAVAGVLTALLQGQAHLTSAQLAERLGAYPRYWANKEHKLRCVRNHIAALDPTVTFEKLTNKPPVLDLRALTQAVGPQGGHMYQVALDLYHQSYEIAQEHGYRNAEIGLLAPTGTIGFVLELDTTGVEPLLWLRMYKTLAGGGTMVVESKYVTRALRSLGYSEAEAVKIAADLAEGKTVVFKDPKHRPVFDTSFPHPGDGRSIHWTGHVRMMAAVQPFLGGAISKTINMPADSSIQTVAEAFRMGNDLCLKSLTVYRDGSKLSQPMNLPGVTDAAAAKRQSPWIDPKSRMLLPSRRRPGVALSVKFGPGHLYLYTCHYPDGQLGEIWATFTGVTGQVQNTLDQAMKLANVSLQYGIPLEAICKTLIDSNYEPKGPVHGHEYIKYASSLGNLIGRLLAWEVLADRSLANLQIEPVEEIIDATQKPDTLTVPMPSEIARSHPVRMNYTGRSCPNCGSSMVIPSGSNCEKCMDCGLAGGCG